MIINPLNHEQIQKISEFLEKQTKSLKPSYVITMGIGLILFAIAAFLLSTMQLKTGMTINGYDLVFEYRLKSAILFLALHVLTLIALVIPRLQDKFQWATFFTLLCLPALCVMYFYEAEVIPGYYDNISPLGIIGATTIFVRWILFGGATYRSKAQTPIFRYFSVINDKIQYFYDEYGEMDFKKAIKKYKNRQGGT